MLDINFSVKFDKYIFLIIILKLFLALSLWGQKIEPEYSWATTAGGENFERPFKLTVDPKGDVIVAGNFNSPELNFGSNLLINSGSENIFISKYDKTGNHLWAMQGGGTSDDLGGGLACDTEGNFVITGAFTDTTQFGTTSHISHGSWDIFIAKYNQNGTVIWAKNIGGTDGDFGRNVSIDDTVNIYITGYYSGPVNFGSTTLSSYGSIDIFIAKYNPTGELIWVKRAVGSRQDAGASIYSDKYGNTVLTGYFENTANFGPITLTSFHARDIFIAKYDAHGNVLWAVSSGGNCLDEGKCVIIK